MDLEQLLVLATITPMMLGLVVESAATVGIPTSIGLAGAPRSGIVIHYVGGTAISRGAHTACRAQVRSWHTYHRTGNGWAGLGYHYCICHHGIVMTGRGLHRTGAHAPGANASHIGILIMLGGTQTPTLAQLTAVSAFRAWLAARHVRSANASPHSAWISTSCPGTNLRDRTRTNNWGTGLAPAPSPGFAYWEIGPLRVPTGNPLLMRGMTGLPVTRLQEALLAWRPGILPEWGADGGFGAETEAAVLEFQRSRGITRDGVYGTESAAELRRLLETMTPAPPPPPGTSEELIDVGRVESWDATIEQDLPVGLPYAVRWDTSTTNTAVSPENRYASFLFSGRRTSATAHLRVVPRDHLGGTWEDLAYRVEVGEVANDAVGAAPPLATWGGGIYTTSEANHSVDGVAPAGRRLRLYVTALSPGLVLTGADLRGLSAPN